MTIRSSNEEDLGNGLVKIEAVVDYATLRWLAQTCANAEEQNGSESVDDAESQGYTLQSIAAGGWLMTCAQLFPYE